MNEAKFWLQWKPPAFQTLSLQQTLLLTKCFSSVLRLQFAGSNSYKCKSNYQSESDESKAYRSSVLKIMGKYSENAEF